MRSGHAACPRPASPARTTATPWKWTQAIAARIDADLARGPTAREPTRWVVAMPGGATAPTGWTSVERPAGVECQARVGDWEADTIIGIM